METPPEHFDLADATKRIARRLLAIGHNRFELFQVELQEQRERARTAIIFAVAGAVLGLLGGIALSAVIVIACGQHFFIALVILTVIYLAAAAFFFCKLARLQKNWETLTATLDQLQKDRECLENHLG